MSAGKPKSPEGHFTLLYFASASSYTKKTSEFLQAPLSCSMLFDQLEQMYPGMKDRVLTSCALTVNLVYVDLDDSEQQLIHAGDEVGIIPPVSSG